MRTRTSMSVLSPTHEVDAAALAMGRAIEACRHYAHSHTRAHPHKHTRTHTHTHTHPCTQTHALRSTSTRAPTRTCRRMDKRAHTTQMHDHTSTIMHTHVAEPQSQQGQWSVTPSMLRRLYVAKGINAQRAARTSATCKFCACALDVIAQRVAIVRTERSSRDLCRSWRDMRIIAARLTLAPLKYEETVLNRYLPLLEVLSICVA